MSASQLLADLEAVGLTVVEEPGWRTRGGSWHGGTPTGVCQHHTAPPNPFPIKALYRDGKIKCNMATHEDGTLYLVAYESCNYSTGQGSSTVLNRNVRPGIPPTANARTRGLVDDMGGNRFFWNYENSHPGDGSPIPDIQLQTIVVSNIVVNNHFGLTYRNIISHAEWSRRKIDPRWNGDNRIAINQIRELVEEGEDVATGPNGEPNWDEVANWAKDAWTWAWVRDDQILSATSHPHDMIDKQQLMVHLQRMTGE